MAQYIITFTNGTVYTTLGAGVIDNKLGISLIGSNYVGYGQIIANNFVRLLENQSNDTAPSYPVAGQLWWNTANKVLSYYDGNKFKPCSSSLLGPTPPLSPLNGDQWWDTVNDQLNVWNGTAWMVVGPNYTTGQGFSGLINKEVTDTSSNQHLVSELQLGGNVVAIVSQDNEFTLSSTIGNITNVKPGISIAPTSMFNGTALNSNQLGGVVSSDFIRASVPSNTLAGSLVIQGLSGLTVGNLTVTADNSGNQFIDSTSAVTMQSGNASITTNGVSGTITVSQEPTLSSSIATKHYVDSTVTTTQGNAYVYTDARIAQLTANVTSQLGNLEAIASAINNDSSYHINTDAKINFKSDAFNPQFDGTVHCLHDNTTDIGTASTRFKHIYNVSISSVAADLAEKYISDDPYVPGTVVVFGGDAEVTASSHYCDHRIAGVVSTEPGYTMNDASSGLAIALTGKVPCLVTGPVKKGDIMVNSMITGVATAMSNNREWIPGCVIGKSMVDDPNKEIRLVMVAVGRF